jgi:YD repeat-containing protein
MSFDQADQVTIDDRSPDQGTEAQADLSASVWQEMDQQQYDTAADKLGSAQQDSDVLDFSVDDPYGLPEDALSAQMMEEEEEALQSDKGDDPDEIIVDDKRTVLKDGSVRTEYDDGSRVTKNPDGKVTEITHPDGKTATVEYDDEGNEKGINFPDGSKWQKTEDGKWARTNKDGEVIDTSGDVSVTEDGDIVFVPEEGKDEPIQVDHHDGKDTFIFPDDSQITRNKDGKVESITHPDGKTAKVGYDENGELNNMDMPDSSQWKRQQDGSWNRIDADGKVVDSVMAVQVTDDGDIIFVPKSEKEPIQVDHRNGQDTFIPQYA